MDWDTTRFAVQPLPSRKSKYFLSQPKGLSHSRHFSSEPDWDPEGEFETIAKTIPITWADSTATKVRAFNGEIAETFKSGQVLGLVFDGVSVWAVGGRVFKIYCDPPSPTIYRQPITLRVILRSPSSKPAV